MSDVTIYHNPQCGTSRTTLKLLRDNDIEPVVINYLKTPLTRDELVQLLKMLGMSAKDLVRTKDKLFSELGLSVESPEADLIDAMIEHPRLMERPIVTNGTRAALGRPPANVLSVVS